ncbi:MAG TPA: two-component regulator propeller domain-containing protein, partial [Puia sp.]|nr:two-component regulator propeller domain-containing protein [Puia sp.]
MHRVLLVLFCLTATIATRAQELAYRQFTVKDGLPGSIVYHCLQDRKGFIWFATNQGVSRFDGRTFRTFTKKDGLPDNDILQIYLDRFDNVWFISFIGIPSVMHNDSIIRFDNCPGVNAISEDRQTDSILLIADIRSTDQAGYYRSLDSPGCWKFTSDIHSRQLYDQLGIVRAITPDNTEFCFSSSRKANGTGLVVENGRAKSRFVFRSSYIQDDPSFTRQIFLSPCGNSLVFLTYDSAYYAGISQLSPLFSLHRLGLNLGLNSYVNCVYCENDSTLWLCARNQGLLRLRNFKTGHFTVTHFFPRSDCTNIIKDKEGGYWVTTFSDGVFYLPNLCFNTLPCPADLSVSSVR